MKCNGKSAVFCVIIKFTGGGRVKRTKKIKMILLCFLAAVIIMRHPSFAAEGVRKINGDERRLMAAAISLGCGGEPFAAQVAAAGVLLDRDVDTLADAVEYFAERGSLPAVDELARADELSKEYRVALDAVDAAVAGCRPLGKRTDFVRLPPKKIKLSLDFKGEDAAEENVIGRIKFE